MFDDKSRNNCYALLRNGDIAFAVAFLIIIGGGTVVMIAASALRTAGWL